MSDTLETSMEMDRVSTPPSPRESSHKWTSEEDQILTDILMEHGPKNWKAIAHMFCERSSTTRINVQCLQRWKKVLQPGLKKGKWSMEEDAVLMELVTEVLCQEGGGKGIRWPRIALRIPGRTSKQCRERWKCNLNPNIVRETFTPEEDKIILSLQHKFGNRWAQIAQSLHGRTENAIKARFVLLQRKGTGFESTTPSTEVNQALMLPLHFPNNLLEPYYHNYNNDGDDDDDEGNGKALDEAEEKQEYSCFDFPTSVAELDRFFACKLV
ncbi:hypothetical protein BASA81_004968 [Batrachochytrium salamandrivorans]|nr:hypothetical protein BASA81_004968 [Batrachochytrium salamandrivorans]